MFRSLYPRTIWLIFLSFSVIVLSFAIFHHWLPKQEEAAMNVKQANDLYAEADKLGKAVKKKNTAIERVKDAERMWIPIVNTRTPSTNTAGGGFNINVNQFQLLLDTKRFRNSIQRAVNNQLRVGGVKVVGPKVPGVSDQDEPNSILAAYYNYPAVPFPVVIHDLGQVTVTGTYDQIMKNVRSWANFPHYLAVVHGLQLQGTAPQLTGTYNLSIVGYIRYDGMYGPAPVSSGSAPAGGGGFAGIPGGGPNGGIPGVPNVGGPGRPPAGLPGR